MVEVNPFELTLEGFVIFIKFKVAGKTVAGFNDVDDAEYKKEKGWIRAYNFTFEGSVAQDAANSSGSHQVSGRHYSDVEITHALSSASAIIHKAMVENTDLEIDVHLTRPAKAGNTKAERAYTKYHFVGANITNQKTRASDSGGEAYKEDVDFSFAQIVVNSDDDSTGEKTESEDATRVSKK